MGEGGKQECAGGYVKRSRIVTGAVWGRELLHTLRYITVLLGNGEEEVTRSTGGREGEAELVPVYSLHHRMPSKNL